MEINEKQLKEIIAKIVVETLRRNDDFVKETDESGILKIETSTVNCEPFNGAQGVYLKDIVTLDEAPRMGAGIMELDHTSFEWTLTYDEYDYVIDGELEIEIDGSREILSIFLRTVISISKRLQQPDMHISYIRQTGRVSKV